MKQPSEKVSTLFETDRSLKNHLLFFALAALAAYVLAFLFRAVEYPNWQAIAPKVNGEFILGTHDAYGWLAGAKGIGPFVGHPMGQLANLISSLTGMSLLQVGYWGPAMLAGLVGVFALGWGWLLFGRTGGLAASVLAPLGFGFLFRSRLGYFDTDVFVLSMPLAMTLGVALLLLPFVRGSWLPGRGGEASDRDTAETGWLNERTAPWAALVLGVCSRFGGIWHSDITMFNFGLVLFAAVLGVVLAKPGRRPLVLLIAAVYLAAAIAGAYPGFYMPYAVRGVGFGAAVCAANQFLVRREMRPRWSLWAALGVLLVALFLSGMGGKIFEFYQKMAAWTGVGTTVSVGAAAGGEAARYPNILASVIEAGKIDIATMLTRFSTNIVAAVLGLAGFWAVLAIRPLAALLLPLLGLGLLSPTLGARFAMFPVPVVAVGLGGGAWLLVQFFFGERRERLFRYHVGAQLLVAVLVALPAFFWLHDAPPSPVLTAPHVRGLIALRDKLPKDAVVWTWWDWGYATQFYAERESPVDGGRHSGVEIYPVALAYISDSPQLGANVLKYSTMPIGTRDDKWESLSVEENRALLKRLAKDDVIVDAPRPVYLTVPFDDMRIMGWISYYGRWNVETGTSVKGKSEVVNVPFRVDFNRGAFQKQGDRLVPVSSIDIMKKEGLLSRNFFGNFGPRLLINDVYKMPVLMEDSLYRGNLVQLMLHASEKGATYGPFELVYADFPNMAVYRVR